MASTTGSELSFLTDPGVQPAAPNLARVADWLLGGDQNFAIDRAVGEQLTSAAPDTRDRIVENRSFEQRAVLFAATSGVHQFVNIGAGLPTVGAVHEIADGARPRHDTRVLYVDIDPVVVAHSEWVLTRYGDPKRHQAIAGDLLDSAELWSRVVDGGLIDPRQPVCILVTGLLHFVKDEQKPAEHLAYYRDQLAAGSMLVLSQATAEGFDDSKLFDQAAEFHQDSNPGQLRDRAELTKFFGNFTVVEPGVAFAPSWRPNKLTASPFADAPAKAQLLAGVARKW